MGKKNKKFKKHVSKPETAAILATETIKAATDEKVEAEELNSSVIEHKPVEESEISILDKRYGYVRRDVTKLLIVLAVLAVIFVGIFFLNIKTSILTSVGDYIYKIGNFQI